MNLRRRLRFLYQRWTRGFDDSELWSLDYTLAHWLLPRFLRFRDITSGIQCWSPNGNIEWQEYVLGEIEYALRTSVERGAWELDERARLGFCLLGQHMGNLWF